MYETETIHYNTQYNKRILSQPPPVNLYNKRVNMYETETIQYNTQYNKRVHIQPPPVDLYNKRVKEGTQPAPASKSVQQNLQQ